MLILLILVLCVCGQMWVLCVCVCACIHVNICMHVCMCVGQRTTPCIVPSLGTNYFVLDAFLLLWLKKTPRPRQVTEGRVYFVLRFQGVRVYNSGAKVTGKHDNWSRMLRAHILNYKHKAKRAPKMAHRCYISEPSDMLPSAKSHFPDLSKWHHQLGTKIQMPEPMVGDGDFSFKPL